MFIRQIKKRVKHSDRIYEYIQYRLIESVRTPYGPRQHVLLNLGSLDISQDKLKTLADSIEAILSHHSQQSLFMEKEKDPELLALAQHFAAIITQKRVQEQALEEYVRDGQESTGPKEAPVEASRFETVDVHSATTSRCRTIGTEHIALAQMRQLGFFGILERCGFSPKEQMYAVAEVCGRMVHPSSERETAR